MKKFLLFISAFCSMMSMQAITSVDEICGEWRTNGSYNFDSAYDGTFATPYTIEGTCVISKVDDTTVKFSNLLDNVEMIGTVELESNLISIAPATVFDYYTFAGDVSESQTDPSTTPVTAIINSNGDIVVRYFVLEYYGTAYSSEPRLVLSGREDVEEPEAQLQWTRNGQAWDSNSKLLGDVTVNAYSDGSYTVTSWQGTEGFDLKFKVNEKGELDILNNYSTSGAYSYVLAGASADDPIYYCGLYTTNKYSAVYDPDWKNKVLELDPEGGYFNVYCYAYDYNDKQVYGGYYGVTWGPIYSLTVNPARNNYNQHSQAQSSQIDLLQQDTFESTLKVYDDGLCILKDWEGVAGYDLKFQFKGDKDSIIVLNEDAQEVITNKGNRYWRVPTGREDYDRACIYEDSPTYNEFHISPERASITFGCSYIYPKDSNKGTKAYYCVKGYNENACDTVAVNEYTYDYALEQYVDTISCNLNKIDHVVIYTLEREDSTLYYCIPDFLGAATGDLLFEFAEDETTVTNLSIEGPVLNGLYYNFIHAIYDSASSASDSLVPGYYYTSFAGDETTGESSLIIDMYYTPSGASEGTDTYYCIDMTGVKDVIPTAIAPIRSDASTRHSSLYDLSGRRLNVKPAKGLYIQNGKKYVK